MTPKQKLVHTIRLGRIIVNMRAVMAATGRGLRLYKMKRVPYEGRRQRGR